MNRKELLKEYLKRLNDGEDLEVVRADFKENFSDVEAMEVMEAEQELISEGTPLEEVQKLCDLHSALFHGITRAERIANAEKEVAQSIQRAKQVKANGRDKMEEAQKLIAIPGHPLNQLHEENEALAKLLETLKDEISDSQKSIESLDSLLPVIDHYAKKGDTIYPQLKVNYGVTGPSNVMWTVDDEIRDELKKLQKEKNKSTEWEEKLSELLTRMEEMIYKEENILFPASAMMFSEDDWKQIYHDFKDYSNSFNIAIPEWKEAEASPVEASTEVIEDEIILPGGSLNHDELKAVMKSLPVEVTFIDANNINKYFNEGPKVFKRPSIALGHDVFSCHPPKVEGAVRKIIEDFKNGNRDQVQIWMEKKDKPYLVTYMAVRDNDGKFLGTMETVQAMEEIQEHFEKEFQKNKIM